MRGARARRHPVDGKLLALSGHRPVVFVLRALGLGDLLTAVPALRAVRRGLPDHELVVGAPAVYEPLVALADAADRVASTFGLDGPPPAGIGPDIAVNLHGRGPQSHRLLESMHPRRLLGFAVPEHGYVGPAWRPDEHEVARWCRLVAESLHTPADPGDLLLARPAIPPAVRGAVVIHPGAAHAARRWPAGRFAEVAAWASRRHLSVMVTGSSQERALAARVAAGAGLPDGAVLAGRLTLTELAALVAEAALVVCGDTGVAHLATAYRAPSVVLFGPTPPSLWGPPADGPHVALWHGTGRGDPWARAVDPALLAIGADEVVAAAATLLAAESPLRPGAAGSRAAGAAQRGSRAANQLIV